MQLKILHKIYAYFVKKNSYDPPSLKLLWFFPSIEGTSCSYSIKPNCIIITTKFSIDETSDNALEASLLQNPLTYYATQYEHD
jgi:hypothetical protein